MIEEVENSPQFEPLQAKLKTFLLDFNLQVLSF